MRVTVRGSTHSSSGVVRVVLTDVSLILLVSTVTGLRAAYTWRPSASGDCAVLPTLSCASLQR